MEVLYGPQVIVERGGTDLADEGPWTRDAKVPRRMPGNFRVERMPALADDYFGAQFVFASVSAEYHSALLPDLVAD